MKTFKNISKAIKFVELVIEGTFGEDCLGVYHYGYLILDKKCKYVGSTADYFPSNHEAANAALECCLENLT